MDNKYSLILYNVLMWLIAFFWMTFTYVEVNELPSIIGRNIVTILCLAGVVYLNFYYLLPKYFFEKKFVSYFIFLTGVVLSLTVLRVYVDAYFLEGTLPVIPDNRELFSNIHYSVVTLSFVIVLVISSFFKFTSVHYQNLQLQQQLAHQQLEAELKFLKAQVNPHFLFNTLNNIYTLSYMQSDQATPMIMKLSSLMRYMLYDSNQAKVPLQKEIDYLQNYIALQRLKTPNEQHIQFEIQGNPTGIQIEPMLFIPLLENSFKHGNVGDAPDGWVRCTLTASKGKISMEVTNSLPPTPKKKDQQGGIGLENIEKRLTLLYPNRHEFEVEKMDDTFRVFLAIELNPF